VTVAPGGGYGDPARAEGEGRTVNRQFGSDDWFKSIGGILFFIAGLLPWWEQRIGPGFRERSNAFGDWLGIIAFVIFVGIGLLTIVIRTKSLPLPRWLLHPTGTLIAAVVGAVCVAVRFFVDPFRTGGDNVTRGIGLYLAGAAAVLVLIGCVMTFRNRDAYERDEEDEDEDEDELDEYGYDAAEQDELIRRINSSLERPRFTEGPRPSRRRPTEPVESQPARRRPDRRRAAGPPIP
jgi:hypothetical protein